MADPLIHSATAGESGSSTEPPDSQPAVDTTDPQSAIVDDASLLVGDAVDDGPASGEGAVPVDTTDPQPAIVDDASFPVGDAVDDGPASGESPVPADVAGEAAGPVDDDSEDGLAPLSDADLESALEALLLVVDAPAEEEGLAAALDTTPLRVAEHLRLLSDKYTNQDRGIDLRRAGGGWRFYTRDRYAPYVEKLLLDGQRAKLTRAALETLAVIAYRQPVTRARVAAVRGVNCDGVIRTLLARGLVEETGTDQETGGFLYRTTELFLERLGLSSLDDLPPIAPLLPEVDSIDEL
ncbi:MAG TPA: SMC-Scp complex subunit ScpB [Actinophytocola sp.]